MGKNAKKATVENGSLKNFPILLENGDLLQNIPQLRDLVNGIQNIGPVDIAQKKKRSLKFFILLALFREADQSRKFGVLTSTKCFFDFAQKLANYFKSQIFSFTKLNALSNVLSKSFFFVRFFLMEMFTKFFKLPPKNLREKGVQKKRTISRVTYLFIGAGGQMKVAPPSKISQVFCRAKRGKF